jgi:hypothetical protein
MFNQFLNSLDDNWREVALHARQSIPVKKLSDNDLIILISNSRTKEELSTIILYLYKDNLEYPIGISGSEFYLKHVNESNHSLREWQEAIAKFHQWLLGQNRNSSFRKMLGYISCCEAHPGHLEQKSTLVQFLLEMLETHGFKG